MTALNQTASVAALKHAIESRNADGLIALYADDAVMRIIDHDNPPSHPRELKGKPSIAAYYEDLCGRAMSHHIDSAIASDDALSFVQMCTYPDGGKVLCAAMLDLKNGKIIRQTAVQAWDS